MPKNDGWVDERLAALDTAGGWAPNVGKALARVWEIERRHRLRKRLFWASAAGVVACAGALVLVSPSGCAMPLGCVDRHARVSPAASAPAVPPVVEREPTPVTPVPAKPVRPQQHARVAWPNFKSSGLPTAPIVVEVYTDYECPACAVLYRETIPSLVKEYVQTGKVRLVHRDFPLPQHPYAKTAARYANAAGRLGQYEAVVNLLFQTQVAWSVTGDIDTQVAGVLSPAQMQKVREWVQHDTSLDATVDADVAMATGTDHIGQTPTLVFVVGEKRQQIPGVPAWSLLRSYLDGLK